MMASMSETPEHPTEPTAPVSQAAPPPPPPPYIPPPQQRPSRLNQVAAWVGIVAGVVFIVAVVFGTGFMVGKHAGGPRLDRDREVVFHRGPMGPMGQFERGPFVFPGPQVRPPEQPTAPTTTTPARP
jgi:hypothetical protein